MRQILSHVRRCIEDYDMIQAGDRIAVGVSGGKDSLLLLTALARLSQFYPKPFTLEAITLSMGYPDMDFTPVTAYCESLGVRHTLIETQLAEILFTIRKESNPCSLCAKMRRGALHDAALKLDCRKVALGHHHDDAVETFLLSLFYEGRISCFQPVTYLDRRDITLIRPLLYLPEGQVRRVAPALPVVKNLCPADGKTKRQDAKELLATLEKDVPALKERIFGAMQRYPLRGWQAATDKEEP